MTIKKCVLFLALAALWASPLWAVEQDHAGHDHDLEQLFDSHATDATEQSHQAHGPACAGHDEEHQEAAEPVHNDHGQPTEDHAGHDDEGHDDHGEEGEDHSGHNHAMDPNAFCLDHQLLERIDALCQAGHIGDLAPGAGMMVRLYDRQVAEKTGISTATPQYLPTVSTGRFAGQVAFNRNRLAKITPLSSGLVRTVHVRPGSQVKQGQPLVTVEMPELAGLKAELLSAVANAEQANAQARREATLYEKGITAQQDYQMAQSSSLQAESAVAKYRQQLINFGLNAQEIDRLLQQRQPSAVITLRAPFDATVTEVTTALGEQVAPDAALMTLADLDRLWIELAVPESQIQQLQLDGPISATFSALPGRQFSGTLFFIGAQVDARTRTLTALAEVANPNHLLRAGLYGEVVLTGKRDNPQLAISANAVQMINDQPYVFVAHQADLFEIRRVEIGARQGSLVAVNGLKPTDNVVINQGYALKSEVLKASLGASCADH